MTDQAAYAERMKASPVSGGMVEGAGFALGPQTSEPTTRLTDAADRSLRCASVLKPLYFWAAACLPAFRSDLDAWAALAEPAVSLSANDPTVHLWDTIGPDALLDAIAGLTGVRWQNDPTAERSFGRVLVRAGELAHAYAALAAAARDGDAAVAGRLLTWMQAVPERQTFGARAAFAQRLGVPPSAVSVKTGWFVDADETALRTHAVTVTVLPDGTVRGTAVLTALPVDDALRNEYAATYVQGDEVLHLHWDHAAGTIAETTASLL